MEDPITTAIYDLASLSFVDAAVWNINKSKAGFEEPALGDTKLDTKFSTWLVPMSISSEGLVPGCPVAMIQYANVDALRSLVELFLNKECLRKVSPGVLWRFFRTYGSVASPEMRSDLQDSCPKEYSRRGDGKLRHVMQMYRLMLDCLMKGADAVGNDGNAVLGIGRILGFNDGMLAHSISTHFGSSGAAVLPLGAAPGCFIGLQNGPGQLRDGDNINKFKPDHNLATSCENPLFGLLYFRKVIPHLPTPESGCWKGGRNRVLGRFLWFHLGTLVVDKVSVSWGKEQLEWVSYALHDNVTRRNLFKEEQGVFTDIKESASALLLPEMLKVLVPRSEEPTFIEEIQRGDSTMLKSIFTGGRYIALTAWLLPGEVSSAGQLLTIAKTLFRSNNFLEWTRE